MQCIYQQSITALGEGKLFEFLYTRWVDFRALKMLEKQHHLNIKLREKMATNECI